MKYTADFTIDKDRISSTEKRLIMRFKDLASFISDDSVVMVQKSKNDEPVIFSTWAECKETLKKLGNYNISAQRLSNRILIVFRNRDK